MISNDILVGSPGKPDFQKQCQLAAQLIEEASSDIPITKGDVEGGNRGDFLSRTVGFSHGGERTVSV